MHAGMFAALADILCQVKKGCGVMSTPKGTIKSLYNCNMPSNYSGKGGYIKCYMEVYASKFLQAFISQLMAEYELTRHGSLTAMASRC